MDSLRAGGRPCHSKSAAGYATVDLMPATADPHTTETRGDVGRGVYALSELRTFVAFYGKRDDADSVVPWLNRALNPVAHRPHQPDYSFSDLISLFVVRECRRKGVRLAEIRKCEDYLRRKWKTDRPFVREEIQTDGATLYVDDEPVIGQIESAGLEGQQVMRELIKDRLTHVHYNDGSAAYWMPAERVLIDPRVQFGAPVVEGTRIPTEAVAQLAEARGPDAAAHQLGISDADAKSAIAFERRLAALQS